jgi:hypothetical protein
MKIKRHRIGSGSILGEESAESLDPFRRAAKDIGKMNRHVLLNRSLTLNLTNMFILYQRRVRRWNPTNCPADTKEKWQPF